MATHQVDRKILSHFAREAKDANATLSGALYQILGLSKMLSRRLLRARRLRRLDPLDEKSMVLYHHIIWMSREGLRIVEETIVRYADTLQFGPELRIFAYKLRASFYHVFCLFHNRPSVSPLNPVDGLAPRRDVPTNLLPIQSNEQDQPPSISRKDDDVGADIGQQDPNTAQTTRAQGGFREPIISMLSEESNVTNPYGSLSGLSPPPGLTGRDQSQVPDPAAFLMPSTNFVPMTISSFNTAANLAAECLSGSSPLRLSIALEYSAFLWDCLHDHAGSRRLANRTIREVYNAQEGMDDHEFEDAAVLVGTLGRMMRRKSDEQTPKMAPGSPGNPALAGQIPSEAEPVPPLPTMPPISEAEQQALRREALRAKQEAEKEEETSTPQPPSTGKPLPAVPQEAPAQSSSRSGMFNIPRRPVGTPPATRSPASAAASGQSSLTTPTPTPSRPRAPATTENRAFENSPQGQTGASTTLQPNPVPEINVSTPTTPQSAQSAAAAGRRSPRKSSSPSSPTSSKVHKPGRNNSVKYSMIPRPRRSNGTTNR